MQIAARQQL